MNYNEFIKNEIIILRWINHLQFILAMQRNGLYEELKDNTTVLGKIMEVIDEYNDIIFGDE